MEESLLLFQRLIIRKEVVFVSGSTSQKKQRMHWILIGSTFLNPSKPYKSQPLYEVALPQFALSHLGQNLSQQDWRGGI
eukprot:scaffold17212_cov95-Cylindrotheca_fusiformis.AAC.1